ncbi:hypothetical protein FisN_10Lu427 [Fistulifera solaris]|uniref:Uncharacterized protein n=1 Tax=Fistulifera solaris TaxID=1519565 RepID=A0A1Z5JUW3_FISSO|nr:hypothetical protein FisN_10Lu427 [Fistulifera solaris]|eukprot:GAX17709.1 hypothetical protein FisN_10Lu427 [Fistulifera solaris]
MESQQISNESLWELIPGEQLTRRQQRLRHELFGKPLELYRFRQDPSHLNEIEVEANSGIMILRTNRTIIFVGRTRPLSTERRAIFFTLWLEKFPLNCAIYGKTDVAIAETATWFWSLKHAETKRAALHVNNTFPNVYGMPSRNFDFTVLRPDQLSRILESNPQRKLWLEVGTFSPEQAVIMATRPCTLNLEFVYGFLTEPITDDGTAFLNALEQRQTIFGSLCLHGSQARAIPLSRVKMERLARLELFDNLTILFPNEESALVPFSATAGEIHLQVRAEYVRPRDFDSLDIVTKNLDLTLYMPDVDNMDSRLISFLHRVTQLGYFESLGITLQHRMMTMGTETAVQALIAAINNNPGLKYLKLGEMDFLFYEDSHLERVFHALSEHAGLRSINLDSYPEVDALPGSEEYNIQSQPYYSALERLLSRNRNLTVLGFGDKLITNGTTIDKIYALNKFFHGSAGLIRESEEMRSLLVGLALTEGASSKYQYTGLLLSNHTDMLIEFVAEEWALSGRLGSTPSASDVSRPAADRLKRKREEQ